MNFTHKIMPPSNGSFICPTGKLQKNIYTGSRLRYPLEMESSTVVIGGPLLLNSPELAKKAPKSAKWKINTNNLWCSVYD